MVGWLGVRWLEAHYVRWVGVRWLVGWLAVRLAVAGGSPWWVGWRWLAVTGPLSGPQLEAVYAGERRAETAHQTDVSPGCVGFQFGWYLRWRGSAAAPLCLSIACLDVMLSKMLRESLV